MNYKRQRLFKKFLVSQFLIVLVLCISACSKSESEKFEHDLSKLQQKIDEVTKALQNADGIAKSDGTINLNVARYFADYIEWELKHPEITKDALARNDLWPGQEKLNTQQRDVRYNEHINRELTDAMVLLDKALAEIKNEPVASEVKPIDWSKMTFKDGNFRVDEQIVFPGGFNILTRNLVNNSRYPNNSDPEWTNEDEAASKSFLPEMRDMGVGIVGMSVPVMRLIAGHDSIDETILKQKIEEIKELEKLGLKADMQLKWGGDNELLEELYPGITEYASNGVPLDIDHPGLRILIKKALSKLVPVISEQNVVVSWDMANEPFFDMKGWTEYGMRNFHSWLAQRHGSISALNKAWKTNYKSFDQIPKPKNNPTQPEYKPGERTAPPKNIPSVNYTHGQWYDIVSFHNYRVASFFGFVASEIRRHAPDAVIHMKGQDNNSLGPKSFAVTDGIDREMLTPSINLHGVDTRPLPETEPRMAVIIEPNAENAILNYDESLYSFHWLGQSFLYDYLTSLEPNRPIIDLEYHAFSINPIRVPDIGEGHARASLWMAHLHGMVANMVWYWNRRYGPNPFPSEEFKSWFYASISTQPIVVAEYFRTMNRLNMFSKEIDVLAKPASRPIRILVSKPSYIQNQKHIEALHRSYEAASFHGIPLGFVTENMLVKNGIPKNSELIIIADAQFVNAEALNQLKKAKKEGVQLLRIGRQRVTNDDYGFPYSEKDIAFLEEIPVLDYASAPLLNEQLGKFIKVLTDKPMVKVQIKDQQSAFGIMNRHATVDGRSVLLLVNLKSEAVNVQLTSIEGKKVNGYDILNFESIMGSEIHLPIKGVRLIELED